MKIGFILDSAFQLLSVFQRPIAEAESSVAYLAIELAKLGHSITLFTKTENNLMAFDIRCCSINDKALFENDFNVIIVKDNSPDFIIKLKSTISNKVKIFLWTGLDCNHQLNHSLDSPEKIAELDGIICTSSWQRASFIHKFKIPHEKITSIMYAISPFFENLFYDEAEFIKLKAKTPLLAYTSRSLLDLDFLFETFADILNHYPDSKLNIFNSSYQLNTADQKLRNVNQLAVSSPTQLAIKLSEHTALPYPCTVEEASSISIMEALAAGLYVITSDLGSLPEYCGAHGKCILAKNLHTLTLESFTGQILVICQSQVHSPAVFYDFCYKQVVDMNRNHTWRVRAREWTRMLENILPI